MQLRLTNCEDLTDSSSPRVKSANKPLCSSFMIVKDYMIVKT